MCREKNDQIIQRGSVCDCKLSFRFVCFTFVCQYIAMIIVASFSFAYSSLISLVHGYSFFSLEKVIRSVIQTYEMTEHIAGLDLNIVNDLYFVPIGILML